MIPQDLHLHTRFSCDSNASMEKMCRAALERGISEIGFSEHFDLDPEDECAGFLDAEAFWASLRRCRKEFADLKLRAGIEIGEPHRHPQAVQTMLSAYPWDFASGSLHRMGRQTIYDASFFEGPPDPTYRRYFRELAAMVARGDFDILAHMDIVKRRGLQYYGEYDPERYEDEIREVLRALAQRNGALEVNTSSLRRPGRQTTPSRPILDWFAQEGGRWVTLGSDAHRPDQVGYGMEETLREIHTAGYTHLASFVARRPHALPFAKERRPP